MQKIIVGLKRLLIQIGKALLAAAAVIAVVTIASVVYGLIADKQFALTYSFIWNYIVGAVITLIGVFASLGVDPERKKGIDMASRLPIASLLADADSNTGRTSIVLIIGLICLVATGLVDVLA